MRFKSNSVLLALVAVFAMSAVAVASASAALPEFKPVPAKKKFTSTSGVVKWTMGTESFTCSKSTTAGEVAGASTLGKVVIKFTGCKAIIKGTEECSINSSSPLGAAGEVITKSLKGELGTVKTSEAASGVGLLLEQEVKGTGITTFANVSCLPESKLTGSLAGEIVTVGKKQATNKLVFGVTSGNQNISSITVKSGKQAPELEAWGTTLGVEGSDEMSFEEALEVT